MFFEINKEIFWRINGHVSLAKIAKAVKKPETYYNIATHNALQILVYIYIV